jgi:hypothetical protein
VSLDWRTARDDVPAVPDCTLKNTAACTIVHGHGPHVLLLGDSNARMSIPTFEAIAKRENLTLSIAVHPLCPWQNGLFFLIGVPACKPVKAQWYGGVIDKLNPDIIVVANRPMDDPLSPTSILTPVGPFKVTQPGFMPAYEQVTDQSLARLRKPGRKIVVIDPIPIANIDDDPLNCLSSAKSLDQCIYQATPGPTPIEQFFARKAKAGALSTLDLDRVVCPRLPACDPVVDGLIVKRDNDHITVKFAAHIAARVDTLFHQQGLLGSG